MATIEKNEFYTEKQRGHPAVITVKISENEVFYQIYCDGYLEPKKYSCCIDDFLKFYEKQIRHISEDK